MGSMPIDAKNTGILELQDDDPLKGAVEQSVKQGPKK
ncbi:MAG: hypothetical protein OJF50_002263 [Nitrospira sp.]|jgi:hypothetical protein|nr:hypothetical protein [Nitrospira sp.]